MALKEKAKVFAVKKALEFMDTDPVTNLPKLLDWIKTLDVKGDFKNQIGNCQRDCSKSGQ